MRWHLKSTASRLFSQPFVEAQINEYIKVAPHWHFLGEFTGDQWIPLTKGQRRGTCFHLITSPCSFLLQLKTCITVEMAITGPAKYNIQSSLVLGHYLETWGSLCDTRKAFMVSVNESVALWIAELLVMLAEATCNINDFTGLILGLRPNNNRRRYFVTTSLIGCVQP